MDYCGFACAVAVGCLCAERADTESCYGGGYDYAGGIIERGILLEERGESIGFVSFVGRVGRAKTYNLIVPNTLLTFRSMTLANASSGCVSNGAPQVAPAFANRISTWSVVCLT